jgi:hypothetical protein
MYQFCYVKIFITNQDRNLLLLDGPGRVRSQMTSVVCQIQRYDFDCNLVVMQKVIIRIPPPLRLKPLIEFRIDGREWCLNINHIDTRFQVSLINSTTGEANSSHI